MGPFLAGSAILLIGVAGGLFVLGGWRSCGHRSPVVEEVRSMGLVTKSMLAARVDEIPAAPDGRIDVYRATGATLDPDAGADTLRSLRTGRGPSPDEIRRGDYANFPYERARGPFSLRPGERPRPLLWSKSGIEDGTVYFVVAFSNGAVKALEPAEFQALER